MAYTSYSFMLPKKGEGRVGRRYSEEKEMSLSRQSLERNR